MTKEVVKKQLRIGTTQPHEGDTGAPPRGKQKPVGQIVLFRRLVSAKANHTGPRLSLTPQANARTRVKPNRHGTVG